MPENSFAKQRPTTEEATQQFSRDRCEADIDRPANRIVWGLNDPNLASCPAPGCTLGRISGPRCMCSETSKKADASDGERIRRFQRGKVTYPI